MILTISRLEKLIKEFLTIILYFLYTFVLKNASSSRLRQSKIKGGWGEKMKRNARSTRNDNDAKRREKRVIHESVSRIGDELNTPRA